MGRALLSFTLGILTQLLPAQGNWAAPGTGITQNVPCISQWVKSSPLGFNFRVILWVFRVSW